jgi:hypothetical protein
MLMLANFQEFFTVAGKDSILDAEEQSADAPIQEILRGLLPDGSSYQQIEEKAKK